jgi:regulator of sigma E protease
LNLESSLASKTPLQRLFVSIAGPAANFLSAIVVSIIMTIFIGNPTTNTKIQSVSENGFALNAGMKQNDTIISAYYLNEKDSVSTNSKEIIDIIRSGKEAFISIQRNTNETNEEIFEIRLEETSYPRIIGVMFGTYLEKTCITDGLYKGFTLPFKMASANFQGIYNIITGAASKDSISGPVKIAQIIRSSANDISSLLVIFIMLSVGLACMNMIPLPGLDGGSAMISIIEIITKKSISEKAILAINAVGIITISAITILVLYNDISQLPIVKKLLS